MRTALDDRQQDELEKNCLLIDAIKSDPVFSLPGRELLQPDTCREVLDRLTPVLGSPNRHVTASLLAKRLAFLTTGSALYAMSVMDLGLDLSLDNCVIEFRHDGELWRSRMPLKHTEATRPRPNGRTEWRRQVVQNLFADGLTPLWQALNRTARTPLAVLWENTAVRVYSLYEKRLTSEHYEGRQHRFSEDFHYLVNEAPAELFGTQSNPLQQYFRPRQPHCCTDGTRIRKTCCYYYRATEPKKYCTTCPIPLAIKTL